jgi:hypothetical protein
MAARTCGGGPLCAARVEAASVNANRWRRIVVSVGERDPKLEVAC